MNNIYVNTASNTTWISTSGAGTSYIAADVSERDNRILDFISQTPDSTLSEASAIADQCAAAMVDALKNIKYPEPTILHTLLIEKLTKSIASSLDAEVRSYQQHFKTVQQRRVEQRNNANLRPKKLRFSNWSRFSVAEVQHHVADGQEYYTLHVKGSDNAEEFDTIGGLKEYISENYIRVDLADSNVDSELFSEDELVEFLDE